MAMGAPLMGFEYNNYILFSTTSFDHPEESGKRAIATIGVLGFVF